MSEAPFFHLTFLRHGESVGNAENRLQGHADFPLSETGRQQARALAALWQRQGVWFDGILSSPLVRALDTARIIAEALGVSRLETDPLWMERDMGLRSGLTIEEIRTRYPQPEFLNPYQPRSERGESDWELYLRAGQALHRLLQRPPGRYLVVSHGALLNKVFYSILGITPQANGQGAHFRLANTSVSIFTYHPASHSWRVEVIGDTHHLNGHLD